jgi:hypothetical protein
MVNLLIVLPPVMVLLQVIVLLPVMDQWQMASQVIVLLPVMAGLLPVMAL